MLSALASLMATESKESLFAVALLAAVTRDTSALMSFYLSRHYRVTFVVRDYILLTLFLNFHNLAVCYATFTADQAELGLQLNNQIEVYKTQSLTTMVTL